MSETEIVRPFVTLEQFPVAGDDLIAKVQFVSAHHDGVAVKISLPERRRSQTIWIDHRDVFAGLHLARVLAAYGQAP